jgi:IS30 family transposase
VPPAAVGAVVHRGVRRRSPAATTPVATITVVAEREEISRGLAAGKSYRAIAAGLGRVQSSVSREVARNGGPRRYRAQAADQAAYRRARRPKPSKLILVPRLRAVVEDRLAQCWSPEQIAAWLRKAYPDDPEM